MARIRRSNRKNVCSSETRSRCCSYNDQKSPEEKELIENENSDVDKSKRNLFYLSKDIQSPLSSRSSSPTLHLSIPEQESEQLINLNKQLAIKNKNLTDELSKIKKVVGNFTKVEHSFTEKTRTHWTFKDVVKSKVINMELKAILSIWCSVELQDKHKNINVEPSDDRESEVYGGTLKLMKCVGSKSCNDSNCIQNRGIGVKECFGGYAGKRRPNDPECNGKYLCEYPAVWIDRSKMTEMSKVILNRLFFPYFVEDEHNKNGLFVSFELEGAHAQKIAGCCSECANVELRYDSSGPKKAIELRTKRRINPGDKLFICYGDGYWGNLTDVENPLCPVCKVQLRKSQTDCEYIESSDSEYEENTSKRRSNRSSDSSSKNKKPRSIY